MALTRTASFWLVLLIGAGLLVWGVERAHQPAPCSAAEKLAAQGLLNQAETAYLAVLKNDAQSDCARMGLRLVEDRRCELARAAPTPDDADILQTDVKDVFAICQLDRESPPPG
jgi:hypothetical protein